MNKFFILLVFSTISLVLSAQQATNSFFLVNGSFTNYTGDVNTSCYPVLSANSEWRLGPKQLISVGYGNDLLDMFTKVSAWSRKQTAGTYDISNYIAIGENGKSYTPGSFITGGSVGIGTMNPQANLHIGKQEATAGTTGQIARLILQPYGHTGGPWKFICRDNASSAFLDLFYGNIHSMTITSSGSVGIGTINPDQKLTVKGKIHAEEVIVDLSVPVADYVFAKDYSLMPLHKVEQYVHQNSHLPDIPSATEIKEQGLSMGEMQNKLLKKIEELTLYVIEQNKKIERLEKQIKASPNPSKGGE
jgi:hypothetical protein